MAIKSDEDDLTCGGSIVEDILFVLKKDQISYYNLHIEIRI